MDQIEVIRMASLDDVSALDFLTTIRMADPPAMSVVKLGRVEVEHRLECVERVIEMLSRTRTTRNDEVLRMVATTMLPRMPRVNVLQMLRVWARALNAECFNARAVIAIVEAELQRMEMEPSSVHEIAALLQRLVEMNPMRVVQNTAFTDPRVEEEPLSDHWRVRLLPAPTAATPPAVVLA